MISRQEQIRFAQELLPLVDSAPDIHSLERLRKIAELVLELSNPSDNGVAFDISEYTYELHDIAAGHKTPDGWAEEARKSLLNQLENNE